MNYWRTRIFQNSFTRDGRRFRVKKWSVKIQHAGRRRTFGLSATDPTEAAAEACRIFQTLTQEGWDPLAPETAAWPRATRPDRGPDESMNAAYWASRLVVRKYQNPEGQGETRELSVRIEHRDEGHHFPLGTSDVNAAALKALEIYRSVVTHGWMHTRLAWSRELTLAVFWNHNPFASTYTTLHTIAAHQPDAPETVSPASARRVWALLEPDGGVRRALTRWLSRCARLEAVVPLEPLDRLLASLAERRPALVLFNRDSFEDGGARFLATWRARDPETAVFAYALYDNSDQIFASISGISGGYILRRRPPARLMDPIVALGAQAVITQQDASRHVRDYFQRLFEARAWEDSPQHLVSLTPREQEILNHMSKGHVDKEIAARFGISIWTVHSHVKKIFEKLGVHSRTEAVVRYLQR